MAVDPAGFFMLGFARQQEASKRLALQGAQVGIQKRNLELREIEQKERAKDAALKRLDEQAQNLVDLVVNAKKEGVNVQNALRSQGITDMSTDLIGAKGEADILSSLEEIDRLAVSLGGSGGRAEQARRQLALVQTPEEAAVSEGRAKVAGARAVASELGGNDQAAMVADLLGVGDRGEFMGLLDQLGREQPGTLRFNLIRGRLNRLSKEESEPGVIFRTGPNGEIFFSQGAGEVPVNPFPVSGNQLNKLVGEFDVMQTGTIIVDNLIERIEQGAASGVQATAEAFAQEVVGVTRDIVGMTGIPVPRAVEELDQFLSLDEIDPEARARLQPTTPGELDILEKTLTYYVARTLQPEDRLHASTIARAEAMADLTGAKSRDLILQRLRGVKALFDAASAAKLRQMDVGTTGRTGRELPQTTGAGTPGPAAPALEAPVESVEEPVTIQGRLVSTAEEAMAILQDMTITLSDDDFAKLAKFLGVEDGG